MYVQAPKMIEQGSKDLVVTQLRHPCLDARLGHGRYIPSDVTVSATTATCILTGPNMGGKSTFMRALGICVVLAHMGSFVPAKEAQVHIHYVHQKLTRYYHIHSLIIVDSYIRPSFDSRRCDGLCRERTVHFPRGNG